MTSIVKFRGLYFTKHALARIRERGLLVSDVWAVWHNPQGSKKASTKGAYVYWRNYKDKRVEVVARKSRWVVISVWVRHLKVLRREESFLKFLIRRIVHRKK